MRRDHIIIIAAALSFGAVAAAASDFAQACTQGAPAGYPADESAAYCSCLDASTAGNETVRSEFESSWPVQDIASWEAGLSSDAVAAARSCTAGQ